LDLLQLVSRSVAEPSTGPKQIVRHQLGHTDALGGFLHDVPNRLFRHAIAPYPPYFVNSAEQFSSINRSITAAASHSSNSLFTQSGIGTVRTNVASLTHQVDDGPLFFPLLEKF
jgi:hypothetical protein